MPTRDNLRSRIAATLRAGRRSKKLTQEALAARAGCSVETISNAERGASLPSVDLFFELAALLEINVGSLVDTSKSGRPGSKARLALEAEVNQLARILTDERLELWLATGKLFADD